MSYYGTTYEFDSRLKKDFKTEFTPFTSTVVIVFLWGLFLVAHACNIKRIYKTV